MVYLPNARQLPENKAVEYRCSLLTHTDHLFGYRAHLVVLTGQRTITKCLETIFDNVPVKIILNG